VEVGGHLYDPLPPDACCYGEDGPRVSTSFDISREIRNMYLIIPGLFNFRT
jgi:hypothetical protein